MSVSPRGRIGTLVRLALHPPIDGAALAAVPGVGPVLADQLGATLLGALGSRAALTEDSRS